MAFFLRCTLAVSLLVLGVRTHAAIDSMYLVTDGQSDYSICIGQNASPETAAIADTLRAYIQRISGANLPIVPSLPTAGHGIVLEVGESRDPGSDVRALGHDGFRVNTHDGNLYIMANTNYGAQNGVYTFLETWLGCRMFSPTVIVIPTQRTIALPPIDNTQVPVITFRMQDFHDSAYNAWHKLNTHDDFGLFVHTFKTLVPPEEYFQEHPEYFSLLNGTRTPEGQLCLTNQDVCRVVVERLRALMQAKPEAIFWSVSQNDTYAPCECEACRAIDSAEGSPSGSILAFVNRVADEFPDKTISTLAYQYSRPAPKHIVPRPNVNIMLCSIECNRQRPLVDDPGCASFVKDVEDWSRLTHNIFLWDYVIQFRNLVSPFPNLHVLQPNMQFFAAHGITSVFEQGLARMHGEFAELRAYLIATLLWNPNVDIDSVMNNFLQGFYGDAAPYVRQYIDTMQAAVARSGEELLLFGYPWPSDSGYLSPAMLDTYGGIFDQAETATAGDTVFLHRVQTARLPVQYAILEQAKMLGVADRGMFVRDNAGAFRARPELEALLTTFVERCKRAGIPQLWEHGITPDEYYAASRRFIDESATPHLARSATVSLAHPASPKYHGGDPAALTDGLKGWEDYHMHWLGFEGEDLDATIDLGSMQMISHVSTDFLQDINSWVFMPLTVECAVSEDGRTYRSIGTVANTVPAHQWGAVIAPFDFRCDPTKARYVRVTAANMKTCPPWHKGSGGLAWIFIDEITVLQE